MRQVQTPKEKQFPSFSIVLETENLANADLKGLSQALASLAHQDIPPTQANEVWLIDSGDTPATLLEQLCQRYPWIKVHHAPIGTGYYKAKILGAELSTGEIVVYFDSDCCYETNWLRNILTPFTQGDRVQIVAGETMTRGLGIYETAMVITYIFPPFSGEKTLTPTSQYFLNNVAFRREFLLQYPIPTDLPLYRGHCAIHAHTLAQQGYTIWRQPQAKATHAPPSSLSHWFWRFLLIGHDYYWQNTLLAQTDTAKGGDRNSMSGLKAKLQVFSDRVGKMLAYEPRHLIYLPFALPVALSAAALVAVGYIITSFNPNYLLKIYNQVLGEM
jgi:glycosyltransferase involved in cell wall biosynthesis